MAGSEQERHAHTSCDGLFRQERIRRLNDELRKLGRHGVICLTRGLLDLGNERVAEVLEAVRRFDQFSDDNDPHGEHDLGVLKLFGERIMWKIDYYDRERLYGSPDPADPAVTTRVMTIMLASEY